MREVLGGMTENSSPVKYLILWMGIVGSAVGLSLPKSTIIEVKDVTGVGS